MNRRIRQQLGSLGSTQKNKEENEITAQEWQLRNQNLKERMQYVFTNNTLSDCQFLVGIKTDKKTFKAHKLLLAMASPVFEAMFYGTMAERDSVIVEDIEPDTFQTLLRYIYTENVILTSFDLTCQLYYAAKKYMQENLQKQCIQYLESHASYINASVGYEFGKLFGEEKLMQNCLNIIRSQTETVLTKPNCNDIELSTILLILDQDYLNIQSELTLFNTLVNIKAFLEKNDEKTELRDGIVALKEAVKKIRYLTMTPKQFTEGPALSDLLTEPEKLSILMNISSPNSLTPMPSGFSTCRNLRNNNPRAPRQEPNPCLPRKPPREVYHW